jgi:hypothetical protein
MSIKNLISLAMVVATLVVVWKVVGIASRMFWYALVASAVYFLYVMYVAPMFKGKQE